MGHILHSETTLLPTQSARVLGIVRLSPVSPSKCCELASIEIYQTAPGKRTATVVVK